VFSQCTSLSSEKKTETVGEFSREIMDRRRDGRARGDAIFAAAVSMAEDEKGWHRCRIPLAWDKCRPSELAAWRNGMDASLAGDA